jgi:hypothetical protein
MNSSNRTPTQPSLTLEERMQMLDEKRKNPGPPPQVNCNELIKIYNTNFRPEVYQQGIKANCPQFKAQGGKKSRKPKKSKARRKSRKFRGERKSRRSRR